MKITKVSWLARILSAGVIALIFAPLVLPLTASAQGGFPSFTESLVQCGTSGQTVVCPGPDGGTIHRVQDECTVCDFVALGQRIINFMIFLAVVGATLLFVYAGLLYMTAQGNSGQVSRAHGVFRNVLIGLVIVLAAWLIIDIVMKTFFDDTEVGYGPWNNIVCENAQDLTGCAAYVPPTQTPGDDDDDDTGEPPEPITCVGGLCQNVVDSGFTTGQQCQNGCVVNQQFGQVLSNFNDQLGAEAGNWIVTSGFEPGGNHVNNCHLSHATCVDLATPGNDPSADEINHIIDVGLDNGLYAEWEVSNDIEKQALVSQGVPEEHVTVANISAPHFSIYCSANEGFTAIRRDNDCNGTPSVND